MPTLSVSRAGTGRGATYEAESRKSDQTNTRPPRPAPGERPCRPWGAPGGSSARLSRAKHNVGRGQVSRAQAGAQGPAHAHPRPEPPPLTGVHAEGPSRAQRHRPPTRSQARAAARAGRGRSSARGTARHGEAQLGRVTQAPAGRRRGENRDGRARAGVEGWGAATTKKKGRGRKKKKKRKTQKVAEKAA